MSTPESRLRQIQQQQAIREQLRKEAIRSQLAVQDAMQSAEQKLAKNLRNKQKQEQDAIRAEAVKSEKALRNALERASKPSAPPTLWRQGAMSPFEKSSTSTFTPSFPQYGTATGTPELSAVSASSTSTSSTSRPTSPSLSIPSGYSLDKSFGIGKYSSELSNETAKYLASLRRPQPPSQPTSSRPVYSRPSSAPTARPAFTRSSSEPRIKFSNQPSRQEIIKNNFPKPKCQVEILNVSQEKINLNEIFMKVNSLLQETKLFQVYVPGTKKYAQLTSLLFIFDSYDKMNYQHENIYYNRGSYDPNTSTTAIEQNRSTFSQEMKIRKNQETIHIKISGNKLSSFKNSMIVRLLFLFLVKVMFYAEHNIFFFDLQRSIENNIIFCGKNIAIARGGKFYPNNLFLKKNVVISYSSNTDVKRYLKRIKVHFCDFLINLNMIDSSGKFFTLEKLYKILQKQRMGRDDILEETYLRKFDKMIE